MKKTIVLVLILMLVFTAVACSATPDRQPAIDAFNEAGAAFNEVAVIVNDYADYINEDTINTYVGMSDLMNQYGDLLASDEEISQESLDEMTAWFEQTLEWATATKTELDAQLQG